jgi:antitoxin Phd
MWKLTEARNRLSQVVQAAGLQGPQIISRYGVEVAVLISYEEYCLLSASPEKISEFFRRSPLAEADIKLSRDTSSVRDDFPL